MFSKHKYELNLYVREMCSRHGYRDWFGVNGRNGHQRTRTGAVAMGARNKLSPNKERLVIGKQ